MCWHSVDLSKRYATSDIYVYKVVIPNSYSYDAFISVIFAFRYKPGEIYYNNTDLEPMLVPGYSYYTINQGFHSYATLDRAKASLTKPYYTIISCIIPKGAVFYINSNDEIVSESIKICGVVKV